MQQLRSRRTLVCVTLSAAIALCAAAFARSTGVARAGAPRSAASSACGAPSAWTLSPVLTPTNSGPILYGVAATGLNDAWVVGAFTPSGAGGAAQPLIEHFDGSTWSLSSVPADGSVLYGVAALAPSNAWAVGHAGGTGGTRTEHWDGTSWSVVASPTEGIDLTQLNSVAAVSASDIWAVGEEYFNFNGSIDSVQLIEHWDGTSWSVITGASNPLDHVALSSVAVSSATDVWIVGSGLVRGTIGFVSFVEHWNGSAWTITFFSPDPTTGKLPQLTAVAANAGGVWVAGGLFDPVKLTTVPFVEHWNGSAWSIVPAAAPASSLSSFNAIAPGPNGDAWAVGSIALGGELTQTHTLIERSTGAGFSIVPDATGAAQYGVLSAVTMLWPFFALTVGTTGTNTAVGTALAESYSALNPLGASRAPSTIGGRRPGPLCFPKP